MKVITTDGPDTRSQKINNNQQTDLIMKSNYHLLYKVKTTPKAKGNCVYLAKWSFIGVFFFFNLYF